MRHTHPVGQLACFRVFPERGSRLFYRVRIFRSLRTLRAYIAAHETISSSLGPHGKAMCASWEVTRVYPKKEKRKDRKLPEMGEILFACGWVGTTVVTHECGHATLGWFRRIRQAVPTTPGKVTGPVPALEERFCYGLGEMSRQIVQQLWDRKLIQ